MKKSVNEVKPKNVTMTLKSLNDCLNSLAELSKEKLIGALSYKVAMLMSDLEPHAKKLSEERSQIIDKYIQLDEFGVPKTKEIFNVTLGRPLANYDFGKNQLKGEKELNELFNVEVGFKVTPMKKEELFKIDIAGDIWTVLLKNGLIA